MTTPLAAATGGATSFSYISAGSANQDQQQVKGSAGQVYGVELFNTVATVRYVKLYNKPNPTSADTPVRRFMLPANGGVVRNYVTGLSLGGTGIGIRITTGAADNDTGAAAANDVLVNMDIA